MPKLPRVNARSVAQALEKAGYVCIRQKGSHAFYEDETGRRTMVPMHGGDVPLGTLRNILRQVDMSIEEFTQLL